MFAQIMAPAMRRDVLLAAADRSPQLLVHEEGEYAGPVAATELGIPWVTHAWGCPLRSHDDLAQLECDAEPLWQVTVPPSDLVRLSAAVSMAIDEARVGRASLAAEQIHAMPSADELVPALETIANS